MSKVQRLLRLKWRLLPLVIAVIILVLALLVPLAGNLFTHQRISNAAQAAQSTIQKNQTVSKLQGVPSRVLIPSLNIDLPVVRQSYSKAIKSWPVEPGVANYAVETPLINNSHGASLIYGHATQTVFGRLLDLAPAADVYVYTANGHIFKYSYTGSQDITPQQTQIVAQMAAAPAGLRMITCDGDYFQYRHLMSFKLLQAS